MKKIIFTKNAPAPIGPYNQAILKNNTLIISGQIPINPATGEVITASIEAETMQVMENLKAVLEASGMTFEHVVKASIFITNMNQSSNMSYFINVLIYHQLLYFDDIFHIQ